MQDADTTVKQRNTLAVTNENDAQDRVLSETVTQGETILAQTLYAYDDAAENGQYQKVTKTVVGDNTAPSVVTTQYTDRNGNVVKTGKVLDGVEYFNTYTFDYVGNPVTYLSAKDSGNSLPLTAEYEYNENGQVVRTTNAQLGFDMYSSMTRRGALQRLLG